MSLDRKDSSLRPMYRKLTPIELPSVDYPKEKELVAEINLVEKPGT